ncbi:MAG: hypothetical protein AAF591_08905 [Verrucomicrobiota bacterium]
MNKKTLILNAAWIAIAAGAFALGHRQGHNTALSTKNSANPALTQGSPSEIVGMASSSTLQNEPVAPADSIPKEGALPQPKMFSSDLRISLEETDPVKRALLFAEVLQNLTPDNANAGFSALRESVPGRELLQQVNLYAYAWGAVDGPAALKQLDLESGFLRISGTNSALSGWAGNHPQKAIDWVNNLEDEEAKEAFLPSLISGVAKSDTDLATPLALSTSDPETADTYIGIIAREQLKNGVSDATAWAQSIPQPDLSRSAIDSVAAQYAREDPLGALEWIEKISTPDQLPTSTAAVMTEWARMYPLAASEHLNRMEASPTRDAAIASFAESVVLDDPEGAMLWTMSIQDDNARTQAIIDSGQRWFRRSPDEATAWLEANNLSPDIATEIQNPPAPTRGTRGGGGLGAGGRLPGRQLGR